MASWAHRTWNLRCACDTGRAAVIYRLRTINEGRGKGQKIRLIAGSSGAWSRGLQTTASLNDTYPVKMPSLSPTMADGTIVKWCKKEGEKFEAGDTLLEIQTDKAVMAIELEEKGILAKILVPEGSADVTVGTVIALTMDEGDDWKNVQVPEVADAASPAALSGVGGGDSKSEENPKSSSSSAAKSSGSDRLLGPAVKSYLQQYGLDAGKISATGPHGNLSKEDVLNYAKDNKLTAGAGKASGADKKGARNKRDEATPASYQDIGPTFMGKTIAKRLDESKSTIPHSYGIVLCEMNNLIDLRQRLTSLGLKVSVNDMLIKCSANALGQNPVINTVWENDSPVKKDNVDISVAVATPTGLITPIVPDASGKDVIAIGDSVKCLARKVRDGKLQPHEFVGGTFCVSNLEMFGIEQFFAIINPPQSAILAVGITVNEIDEHGNALSTSKLMLSYDARVIKDDDAAKFLADLKKQVEDINEVSMGLYDLGQKVKDVKTDQAMKEKETKEEEASKKDKGNEK